LAGTARWIEARDRDLSMIIGIQLQEIPSFCIWCWGLAVLSTISWAFGSRLLRKKKITVDIMFNVGFAKKMLHVQAW
jgi:hypothetical protein